MTTINNQQLHDLSVKHSILLESYKLYEFQKREKQFLELRGDLTKILGSFEYTDIGFASKRELNKLIAKVRKIQRGFYTSIGADILAMFEEFTKESFKSSNKKWTKVAKTMVVGEEKLDVELSELSALPEDDPSGLLLFIVAMKKREIPGVGLSVAAMVAYYIATNSNKLESLIRTSWSNGLTKEELLLSILGSAAIKQGANGILKTMRHQLNSVIDTTIAFASEQVESEMIAEKISKKYMWISIMDSRTTDTCRGRNRKTFEVGKGPLPPAHMHCRSKIMPLIDESSVTEESISKWSIRQIQESKFNIEKYGIIDSATGVYKATKPITPSEFFKQTKE